MSGAPRMNDLVSILIPAYNAERWISQSLASALAQTWRHTEVIVVDDGSTDRTLDIAKGYASDRVKVVGQKNIGAAGARNAALGMAQGDYVQWLDADDLLHPEKIERQLANAGAGRRSKTLLTCSWGRFFARPERARFVPDTLWEPLSPVDWISRKFRDNAFMFPATWLVSRRLIEVAGQWDTRLSLDDDGEYMCRLVGASEGVEFVPSARCYYRIGNTNSMSWQQSPEALQSACLSMNLCVSYLRAMEDSAATRAACLRFVQDCYALFFPEHEELVSRCNALARTLGGELHPPLERPHFKLFRKVFGWQTAKATRSGLDRSRLRAARWMESLGIGPQTPSPCH